MQLSLLREPTEKDNDILDRAEQLKKEAIVFFNAKIPSLKGKASKTFFSFSTTPNTYDESGNAVVTTPSTPRLLTRRYRGQLTEHSDGNIRDINSFERISSYWANQYYSCRNAHTYWFSELCRRIVSLSFAVEFFSSTEGRKELRALNEKGGFVLFDHQLSVIPVHELKEGKTENERANLQGLIDKTISLLKPYKKIALLGCCNHFRDRTLLDSVCSKFQNIDYEIFGNDYIFLNNAEFIWEETRTVDWGTLMILPPETYGEKSIKDVKYFYTRSDPSAPFIRFDAYSGKVGAEIINTCASMIPVKAVD